MAPLTREMSCAGLGGGRGGGPLDAGGLAGDLLPLQRRDLQGQGDEMGGGGE